ncbi:MAG: hypothetical protein ACOC33_00650 [bacterium]
MMKIDPPFPDFMQNGVKSDMIDLTGKLSEPSGQDISEIKPDDMSNEQEHQYKQVPKQKYKIQSLFWLINPKLYKKIELEPNEAMFCTISFNIDFGNLRIELYNINEKAFNKNVMFLSELDRLIDGVIYPADCFSIGNKENIEVYPIEQLITFTNEPWQKQRPIMNIVKNKEYIKLTIKSHDESTSHHYYFTENQKDMFNYSCRYVVTTGFQLVGMNK